MLCVILNMKKGTIANITHMITLEICEIWIFFIIIVDKSDDHFLD